MTFEKSFRQVGKAMDSVTEEVLPTIVDAMSSIAEVVTAFKPHPWAEATALKELSREHGLDVVERNSVQVTREEGSLVARYHDGSEWQDITVFRE